MDRLQIFMCSLLCSFFKTMFQSFILLQDPYIKVEWEIYNTYPLSRKEALEMVDQWLDRRIKTLEDAQKLKANIAQELQKK